MRGPRSLTWLSVALVGALLVPPAPVLAAQPFCGDVQLVWARGTGQAVNDRDNFQLIRKELDDLLGASVSYTTYELGQEDPGFGGFKYLAAGEGFVDLTVGWASHAFGVYRDSVSEGVAELNAWLSHRTIECPGEVYVLAGLSQGAEAGRP